MWVRWLSKNVDNIESDNKIINKAIAAITETWIIPSDSTCKIEETFFNFNLKI